MSDNADELNENNQEAQEAEAQEAEAQAKAKEAADFCLRGRSDFLCEAFRKAYPDTPIKEEKKNGHKVLTFPSVESARDFFKAQAQMSNSPPFLVQKYENDKPVDDYHFSIGTGQLFSGTKESILKALNDELTKADVSPENKDKIIKGIDQFTQATMMTKDYRQVVSTGRPNEVEQPVEPPPVPRPGQ